MLLFVSFTETLLIVLKYLTPLNCTHGMMEVDFILTKLPHQLEES